MMATIDDGDAMHDDNPQTDKPLNALTQDASQSESIGIGDLCKSEARCRDLLENVHVMIGSLSLDGSLTYANRAWRETLGYGQEEITDLSIFDVIRPDDHAVYRDAVKQAMAGSVGRIQTTLVAKDGRRVPVDGYVNCSQGENDEWTVQIVLHGSSIKGIEEQLRLARLALESAANAIVITDRDGNFIWINPAFTLLTGYGWKEAIGKNPRLLKSGKHEPEFYEELWDTILAGRVWQGETINRRKDSSLYIEEQTIAPVVNEQGEITHFIGIKQDITARKRAEIALQEHMDRLEELVQERTRELLEAHGHILAQQRLERDLQLAEQVQTSLLPREVPVLQGFEFAAAALPAQHVNGDVYDFIVRDPTNCQILLADIAGKGISAALLTSTARALIRAETDHTLSPATILTNVNQALFEDLLHAEKFITVFMAQLNARLGQLTYANAGHTEGLWWRHLCQEYRTLPATGLPVGIFADTSYVEETLPLMPGDVLVFYSDGIPEARNSAGEFFGMDRLITFLLEHVSRDAPALVKGIVDAVETFREDAPRADDLTLIVLKALPRSTSFVYPATLDRLDDVTATIRQVVAAYGDQFAYEFELAATEILSNIVRHAYRHESGEIRGQINLVEDQVALDLYDDGLPFDITSVPEPDFEEPQEGGYGLAIARQLLNRLDYSPETPAGNHWCLTKLVGRGECIESV